MRRRSGGRPLLSLCCVVGSIVVFAAFGLWTSGDPAVSEAEAVDEVDDLGSLAPDDDEDGAEPGSRAAHRIHQAHWIAEICLPATDDARACTAYAGSEAWPWDSEDPLADLAATYADPSRCDRWMVGGDARGFCEALAGHYQAADRS
jgi:hypothetical protein